MRLPNKIGGGSYTNLVGLHFEQTTSLRELLLKQPGIKISGDIVYYNNSKIGQLCGKTKIYTEILSRRKIDYKKYISKRLLPDDAILIDNNLYIIEKKFQSGAGSVDEKLQTCDFKKKQYIKLFEPAGITVHYFYILSDWFKQECYADVHEYITSVGCKYFFNVIPLNEIGIQL
jgi:hypothetical protein